MNYENYDYLTSSVLWKFGVRGELDEQLEKQMKHTPPLEQINLDYKMVIDRPQRNTKDNLEYVFNLDYNVEKGNYYLNSIDGKLLKQDGTVIEQQFKLFNQSGLNLIQMAGVMDGRFAYREYQRWDKDSRQSIKEAGWFFRDINRLTVDGNPMVRVLNDSLTKFNIFEEMGKIPLNLTQKQKNDLAKEFMEGNPGYSRIPLANGTAEKIELTLHPQKGIAAHTFSGERVRWKRAEGKAIFEIEKPNKVSETTAKLIEKANETEFGEQQGLGKGGKKR